MAFQMPHGRTLDVDFMFTKLCVDDLERSAEFYTSVFGLIEMNRVEAQIIGRPVSEIVYQPTYAGGPLFILAEFAGEPQPATDEVILGFAAKDLEGFLERVQKAGGSILEPIQEAPGSPMRHAFVADPEGHRIQISQALG